MKQQIRYLIILLSLSLIFGCIGSEQQQEAAGGYKETNDKGIKDHDVQSQGKPILSQDQYSGLEQRNFFFDTLWLPTTSIFYDDGKNEKKYGDEFLILTHDNKWVIGDKEGTFEVVEIEENDWARWSLAPFDAQKKIVLSNWKRNSAKYFIDGPIKENKEGWVSFWLIYRDGPPELLSSGQVQILFEAE